jgi:hypothetical protein
MTPAEAQAVMDQYLHMAFDVLCKDNNLGWDEVEAAMEGSFDRYFGFADEKQNAK